MTVKPRSCSCSCSASSFAYCGVRPHLLATLTTRAVRPPVNSPNVVSSPPSVVTGRLSRSLTNRPFALARSLPPLDHSVVPRRVRAVGNEAGSLPLTGERTVPGIPEENYWFRRHEAAYEWLLPHVVGLRVLEVGCGEGYGTALLAGSAAAVIGLDYDALTAAHAASTYPQAFFVRGNL